jgi:hypothetical protein
MSAGNTGLEIFRLIALIDANQGHPIPWRRREFLDHDRVSWYWNAYSVK